MAGDKSGRLAALIFGLALGGAALVLLASANMCKDRTPLQTLLEGDDTRCWEFWLNRYQTGIGVGFALITGLLAWRSTQKQANISQIIENKKYIVSVRDLRGKIHEINRVLTKLLEIGVIEKRILDLELLDIPLLARRRIQMLEESNAVRDDFKKIQINIVGSDNLERELMNFRDMSLQAGTEARVVYERLRDAASSVGSDDMRSRSVDVLRERKSDCDRAREHLNLSFDAVREAIRMEEQEVRDQIVILSGRRQH